ncbi:MAG TPA: hypothetical protein VIT44_11200 [Cyclobacteriaceae bacterium]
MKKILLLFFLSAPLFNHYLIAQTDSVKLNMPGAFGLALDGNIHGALEILNAEKGQPVLKKHEAMREELNRRFGSTTDRSSYLINHRSAIDSLLLLHHAYWRKSMINYPIVYDTMHRNNLVNFLNRQAPKKQLTISSSNEDLEENLKSYIQSKGYYTFGFGRVGKYFDLLVWKKQTDTVYQFTVNKEKINCPIVFMEDFVTLGWEEYATADKLHPGGWATDKSLYCVKKAYDLNSESFKISYLAHEGRHFNDFKLFPGLSSPNLEYRAKLTEFTLLDKTLWDVLTFFINSSNAETTDGHQLANYYAVRDLSRSLFKVDFQKDLEAWKKIPVEKIHKTSAQLLIANTKYLKKNKTYIK